MSAANVVDTADCIVGRLAEIARGRGDAVELGISGSGTKLTSRRCHQLTKHSRTTSRVVVLRGSR